jgi:hypothetical protein
VENYAYLIQVNDYKIENLEKLYLFGRKLLTRLPNFRKTIPLSLRDDVSVRYLDLKQTFQGSIKLDTHPGILGKPIATGTQKRPEIVGMLSEVILTVNEKYSNQKRTVAETACIEKFVKALLYDNQIRSEFKSNNDVQTILDFGGYSKFFNEKLNKMESYNPELFANIKNDPEWKEQIRQESARMIGKEIKSLGEIEIPSITNDIAENKKHYRDAIHSCNDYLLFEEKHLAADKLDFLEDILLNHSVSQIKILGSAHLNKEINEEFFTKVKEIEKKLAQKNIKLDVKIAISKRLHKKFHDRFAIGSNTLWSLPPISAVFDGSSSTFNQHVAGNITYEQVSKKFDEWWNDSDALDIFTEWDKIKNVYRPESNALSKAKTYNCIVCNKEFTKSFKLTRPLCEEHLDLKKS